MPPNAGWKKPSARPKHAASTNTDVSVRWPLASMTQNTVATAARERSEAIISPRRE